MSVSHCLRVKAKSFIWEGKEIDYKNSFCLWCVICQWYSCDGHAPQSLKTLDCVNTVLKLCVEESYVWIKLFPLGLLEWNICWPNKENDVHLPGRAVSRGRAHSGTEEEQRAPRLLCRGGGSKGMQSQSGFLNMFLCFQKSPYDFAVSQKAIELAESLGFFFLEDYPIPKAKGCSFLAARRRGERAKHHVHLPAQLPCVG